MEDFSKDNSKMGCLFCFIGENDMKRLKNIISLVLVFTLMLSSITVYAVNNENVSGRNNYTGISDTGGTQGGASWSKTAIIGYIVNTKTGGQLGSIKGFCNSEATFVNKADQAYFTNRFGSSDGVKFKTISEKDVPTPVLFKNGEFVGNYDTMYEWVSTPITKDGITYEHTYNYLATLWMKEVPDMMKIMQTDGISFCVEPVAVHALFKTGDKNSQLDGAREYLSTVAGWAKLKQDKKCIPWTYTDTLDADIMAHVMTLRYSQFGWSGWKYLTGDGLTGSGKVDYDDLRYKGYGIGIFNVKLNDTVSTADLTSSYPVTDPSSPYSVIKCYEDLETFDDEESPETEEYVPVNTYIYNHAPANLTIEDETGYVVTDWEIIAVPISTVSDKQPYDEIVYGKTPVEHGDSAPQTVTLDDTKPTLVIRLRSDIEPTPPEPKEVRINGTKTLTEQY
jgi:hypothetical protein